MKVIILAPTPPPIGGISIWTERMLNSTLKNNWTIKIVDEKILGNREVFGKKSKKKYLMEIKRTLNIWKNLNEAIKDPDVTVVHSCIPSHTLSMLREFGCAVITKMHKKAFIIHFRCTVPNITKSKFGIFVLKKLCCKSDLIIALNHKTKNFLKQLIKTDIEIIPNFINDDEIRDKHYIRKNIKNVVYVGGVVKEKGCEDIIEVAKRFEKINFFLIGNVDKEFVERNNLNNVYFTGVMNHNEIQKMLDEADIFMFLSYFSGEGFSNALLEAMSNGLPCIVSDWAANKDMIENRGGIVVPIKSISSVIEALKEEENYENRKKQSSFNINKVRNEYSKRIILDRYVDCYEKVIKKYINLTV